MKISEDTLKMLKWMATVNGGIKIDPGNEIYSKAESQAMACKCEISETFVKPFVTTNLQKFLIRILAAMITGSMDLKVELVEACRQPDCIPQLMLILEKYGL